MNHELWIGTVLPAVLTSGVIVQALNGLWRAFRKMRKEAQGRQTVVVELKAEIETLHGIVYRTRYLAINAGVPLSELPAMPGEGEVNALGESSD